MCIRDSINRFVIDLASAFHRFYGSCRIQGADSAVQQARLALCILSLIHI